jgi:vacuolar-type H+-ATPase subunit H
MSTPLETCLSQIAAAYERHTQAIATAQAKYDARIAPARDVRDRVIDEADRTYAPASEPINSQFEQAIAPAKKAYQLAQAEAEGFPGRKGAATRAFNKAILPAQRARDDAMAPIETAWSKTHRDADTAFEQATRAFLDELNAARGTADQELNNAINAACDIASELTGKDGKILHYLPSILRHGQCQLSRARYRLRMRTMQRQAKVLYVYRLFLHVRRSLTKAQPPSPIGRGQSLGGGNHGTKPPSHST